MPKRDDELELNQWLESVKANFLECRDFGHSWKPMTAHWSPDQSCFIARLRCSRCRTERIRHLSSSGSQLSNHYVYADGYSAKGLGRLTGHDRDALRLASLTRGKWARP